jgi:hypothetical protein
MEIKAGKFTRRGNHTSKRLIDVDRDAVPEKDMRISDRLNYDIENDHGVFGAGAKRDPKTGRMLPRYGDKNVRDNSVQYDRARYKNDPKRSLYASATNTFRRCLLRGIPIDKEFYEMEHTHYRKLKATKDRPAVPAGEKFKDVIWGLRAYFLEMWEECAKTDYKCPCCENTMIINAGKGQKHKHSRTLDRIKPAKGYIKGNLRFVCDFCNRIMSSATPEEVNTVALFMKENG